MRIARTRRGCGGGYDGMTVTPYMLHAARCSGRQPIDAVTPYSIDNAVEAARLHGKQQAIEVAQRGGNGLLAARHRALAKPIAVGFCPPPSSVNCRCDRGRRGRIRLART